MKMLLTEFVKQSTGCLYRFFEADPQGLGRGPGEYRRLNGDYLKRGEKGKYQKDLIVIPLSKNKEECEENQEDSEGN